MLTKHDLVGSLAPHKPAKMAYDPSSLELEARIKTRTLRSFILSSTMSYTTAWNVQDPIPVPKQETDPLI